MTRSAVIARRSLTRSMVDSATSNRASSRLSPLASRLMRMSCTCSGENGFRPPLFPLLRPPPEPRFLGCCVNSFPRLDAHKSNKTYPKRSNTRFEAGSHPEIWALNEKFLFIHDFLMSAFPDFIHIYPQTWVTGVHITYN